MIGGWEKVELIALYIMIQPMEGPVTGLETCYGGIMLPEEIILETTNFCNLRCRFCHIHGEDTKFQRPQGIMARGLWKKIISEAGSWQKPISIVSHGAGEPLLYPYLRELLLYAKKFSNITIGFMTNAMLLSQEMAEFLVENQIDWLAFSVDGIIPETHDNIRVNSSLETVERNIGNLIRIKDRLGSRRPLIHFNMVAYPEIKDQKAGYLKRWISHASTISISRFRPVNSKRLWDGDAPVRFRPCAHLFRQAVVGWDGRMGLCCEDINAQVSPGDLNRDCLNEVFEHSPVFQKYRKEHQGGRINHLALCRDCHVWAAPVFLDQRDTTVHGYPVHIKRSPAGEIYEMKRM